MDPARNGQRFRGPATAAHLNQKDGYCRRGDRCGRVQYDAQLALVGIAVERMNVRHLHNNQQREQSQTQKNH